MNYFERSAPDSPVFINKRLAVGNLESILKLVAVGANLVGGVGIVQDNLTVGLESRIPCPQFSATNVDIFRGHNFAVGTSYVL